MRQTTLTAKHLDHHSDSKLDANDFPDGSLTEMDVDHIVRSRLGSKQSYIQPVLVVHKKPYVCMPITTKYILVW